MQRYFIQLSYKGTNYHGWQIQPNAASVQEKLNQAISTIVREQVNVVGAGRTDTGVHASFFVAHFDLQIGYPNLKLLKFKLNSFLPNDIYIETIFEVDDEAHARFSATARTYHYFLSRNKQPYLDDFVTKLNFDVDVAKMNQAANAILAYEDFTSFSKLHTDVKTNNCKVSGGLFFEKYDLLVFTITADRFLRNMVRAIVGTLLEVGRGKFTVNDVCEIIEQKNRGAAGASALGRGLFLSDIQYPEPVNSKLIRKPHFLLA